MERANFLSDTMNTTMHQLIHLAQAYFHQDYDLEAPTTLDVVRSFQQGEPPGAIAELVSDLESVLNSSMSEKEMRNLWISEYGASYDPLADGKAYRSWFADILKVLTAR
jgi:hypothetical protein